MVSQINILCISIYCLGVSTQILTASHLLFGCMFSHHVAEVLLLHLSLLLPHVFLVLLGHGHGVQLQLLWGQGHLHTLRLLASTRLTPGHGLKRTETKDNGDTGTTDRRCWCLIKQWRRFLTPDISQMCVEAIMAAPTGPVLLSGRTVQS